MNTQEEGNNKERYASRQRYPIKNTSADKISQLNQKYKRQQNNDEVQLQNKQQNEKYLSFEPSNQLNNQEQIQERLAEQKIDQNINKDYPEYIHQQKITVSNLKKGTVEKEKQIQEYKQKMELYQKEIDNPTYKSLSPFQKKYQKYQEINKKFQATNNEIKQSHQINQNIDQLQYNQNKMKSQILPTKTSGIIETQFSSKQLITPIEPIYQIQSSSQNALQNQRSQIQPSSIEPINALDIEKINETREESHLRHLQQKYARKNI